MRRMACFLFIVGLLTSAIGCDSEQEADEIPPEILSLSALGGWETESGATIAIGAVPWSCG